MGDTLKVSVSLEKFRGEGDTNKKLDMLFEVLKDQQNTCIQTVEKYNGHFEECDELTEAYQGLMEGIKLDVENVKKKVKFMEGNSIASSGPSRKKEFGIGIGIGTGSGITIWESIKYFLDWLKHLT